MNSGVTQQPLPQRGGQDAAARRKRRRATASTPYTEYARFADDLAILIGAHPRHDWPMRVEKRLREELAKLQVEIYEVRRDKSSIKGGDDWGRGIIDDLKDSDWVLSPHATFDTRSRRLPRHLRSTGEAGRLQPCTSNARQGGLAGALTSYATALQSSVRGAARHSGVTARRSQKRHPHGGAADRDIHMLGHKGPWPSRASRTRNSCPTLFRRGNHPSPQPRRIRLVDGLAAEIGCGHSLRKVVHWATRFTYPPGLRVAVRPDVQVLRVRRLI
jgi:hypothetical protein